MRATLKKLEVRGKEKKTSQKGKDYIIARCEDDTGLTYEFYDPNIENFEYYKKGQQIDMIVELTQYRGNWQLSVSDIKYVDSE